MKTTTRESGTQFPKRVPSADVAVFVNRRVVAFFVESEPALSSTARMRLSGWLRHRGLTRQYLAFAPDDDPMRALLLVHVETLAVVAAHAFGHDDLRALDGAPLAGLLAQLAGIALGPALDAEDRDLRQQPQRCPERTEKPTIEIPHEHRRRQQHAKRDPHRRRFVPREHPERLYIAIDRHVAGGEKIQRDHTEDAV